MGERSIAGQDTLDGQGLYATLSEAGLPGGIPSLEAMAKDRAAFQHAVWQGTFAVGGREQSAALHLFYNYNYDLGLLFQKDDKGWALTDIWHNHLPIDENNKPQPAWMEPVTMGEDVYIAVTAIGDRGTGVFHKDTQLYDLKRNAFVLALHRDCYEQARSLPNGIIQKRSQSAWAVEGDALRVDIRQSLVLLDYTKAAGPDIPETVLLEGNRILTYVSSPDGLMQAPE